jgi:hypothetical protein
MIHSLGIILAVLGGMFAFAGFLALAFGNHNSDDCQLSAGSWVDAFLFCGIGSFIGGFIKGVNAAFHNRSDSRFSSLMVLVAGLAMLGVAWFII